MRKSFGQILNENGGLGPGFDLLRLGLALAILVSHASGVGGTRGPIPELFHLLFGTAHADGFVPTPGGEAPGMPWMKPIVVSHVPMFFALSGFLVVGSAFRTKRVMPFLALRFFRIFPALCVEVVLSAIILGAIFTSLPLHEYFTSRQFFTYFGNVLGIVQMELPGVTLTGEGSPVNANLWTLPSEFDSYLVLAALIVSGLIFNRRAFTIIFTVATCILIVANSFFGYHAQPWVLAGDINVYYFFVGAMFFLWRDYIIYDKWLFLACIFGSYLLLLTIHAVYIIPAMLTYITVFIGLTNFPKNRILQSGDYSYGIYLYGFPITQMVATAFSLKHNYFGLLIPSVLCTSTFAFLSWHLVEKRFLGLRKRFSAQSAKITEKLHPEAFSSTELTTNELNDRKAF